MSRYDTVPIEYEEQMGRIADGLPYCSYEELEDTMRAAREEGEATIIRRVAEEAASRSQLDGGNTDYSMLELKCQEAIDMLEPKE